jgi:hypothetical protein
LSFFCFLVWEVFTQVDSLWDIWSNHMYSFRNLCISDIVELKILLYLFEVHNMMFWYMYITWFIFIYMYIYEHIHIEWSDYYSQAN